jgi:hypothetical protein
MNLKAFAPSGQGTATISATSAAQRVAIDANSSAVRVVNKGPGEVFVLFGDNTVTSTTGHMSVLSGATEVFTKGSYGYVSVICAGTDTATVRFTSGEGM